MELPYHPPGFIVLLSRSVSGAERLCGDVDQQAVADGIVRDILAASENIGQEPLAVTTYCQENDDGAAAGGNAP